jgi:predicted nucleotidyltransferase
MDRAEVLKVLGELKSSMGTAYGILELGIFGSMARNTAGPCSDVDIVVRLQSPNPFFLVHIKDHLESELSRKVDIVRMREKMSPLLKQRIERDAIYV